MSSAKLNHVMRLRHGADVQPHDTLQYKVMPCDGFLRRMTRVYVRKLCLASPYLAGTAALYDELGLILKTVFFSFPKGEKSIRIRASHSDEYFLLVRYTLKSISKLCRCNVLGG